jgi:hypothetical protein
MDADRRQQLSVILEQMQPPDQTSGKAKLPYTMYAASVDLLGYFEAGTVHHAIVSLQSTAGAKAVNCKATVNKLKTTGTASDPSVPAPQPAPAPAKDANGKPKGGTPAKPPGAATPDNASGKGNAPGANSGTPSGTSC